MSFELPALSTRRRVRGRILAMLATAAVALSGITLGASAAHAADIVDVPDANLKTALNAAIAAATETEREPDATITDEDAVQVSSVTWDGAEQDAPIRSLEGIGAFTGLSGLTLPNNRIADITPIQPLKALHSLNLDNNRVQDVTVFDSFDSSWGLRGTSRGNRVSIAGNQIANLSPLYWSINTESLQRIVPQNLYLGAYTSPSMTLDPLLRPYSTQSTSSITSASRPRPIPLTAAEYDRATGVLVLTDPENTTSLGFNPSSSQVDPVWTLHFTENPYRFETLRVNEVESDGDTRGDWVELYNTGESELDLAGLILTNQAGDQFVIPAGEASTIAAGGYRAFVVSGGFDLGADDAVGLYAPGTTEFGPATKIDGYAWTEHAVTTYGRTAPGDGGWDTTGLGTFGAENVFEQAEQVPTVTVTGETAVTGAANGNGSVTLTATVTRPNGEVATDAPGRVTFAQNGSNRSGPVALTDGLATWTATGLPGSAAGAEHQFTATYASAGSSDPYANSEISAPHTVTVTVGEFSGEPTVPENVRIGESAAIDLSGITPAPDSVSYQWQGRFGSSSTWSNVRGQGTLASYTPTLASISEWINVPGALRATVTVSAAGQVTKTFTTSEVSVTPLSFLTTPAPVLSTAAPRVGDTITATHEAWTSAVTGQFSWHQPGYSYQWLRDGEPIAGATDSVNEVRTQSHPDGGPKTVSYVVTTADQGHVLSLQVKYLTWGGEYTRILEDTAVVSADTAAVGAAEFTTSPAPVIDNTAPTFGDTLTATTAAWSPAATLAYQWLRDGQPIPGASSASYKTVAADVDAALSVRVTGAAAGVDAKQVVSTATAKVKAAEFTASPAPAIDNAAPKVGDRLTATVGAWSPAVEPEWQWLRDGQPISGATGPWYTVVAADAGKALSVRVTGTLPGYAATEATSTATAKVPVVQTKVKNTVKAKYSVKVQSLKGKKLTVTLTANRGYAKSKLPKRVTVKVTGVKSSYQVKLKSGKGTFKLGKKAKKLKKGTRVTVTVTAPKASYQTVKTTTKQITTTTYTAAKAAKKVRVRVR